MNKKIIVSVFLVAACALAGAIFVSLQNDAGPNSVELANNKKSAIQIIAFGDSLTAGYDLPQEEAYPAQLEKVLREKGYEVTVINSGVSGETTRGNLERAQFIRAQNPNIVILGIGGNDALRFLPVADTRQNIISTIEILKSGMKPPTVVLLQMQAPLNAGLLYKQEFDSLYQEIAEKNDLVLIPFITNEIYINPENKLRDGIHYNQQGYQKVVEKYLLPKIEILMKDL
ncbi:MAG: hypothetical protein RLZZ67_385 [Candidatus Parcubacteria bacterium]|jgi:acyl-CoA thioesterase-1